MIIVFIILFVIISIITIIFVFKYRRFAKYILKQFKHVNVWVYGVKRSGKDVLFQWVINKIDEFHYCNIPYSKNSKVISIKELSVEPNTYDSFINNNLVKTPHKFKDGSHVYLSDVQNWLPNYKDSELHKKFPSLPIFYSLSGQLYDMCIHCNSQTLTRAWKPLREQSDFWIKTIKTIKLPFILIVSLRTYDKYESALSNLLPLKARMFNKFSKAEVDKYNSTNGLIKTGIIIIRKSKITYNTRYFEKLLLKGKRK